MADLLSALGLVLVLEGAVYALFPKSMKRMVARAAAMPDAALRIGGVAAAFAGVLVVWLVRG